MGTKVNRPIIGTVSSRRCHACGHHEVGIITEQGEFHALRPGMRIQILEGPSPVEPKLQPFMEKDRSERPFLEEKFESRPWIPEPLRRYRDLRLKYGVLLKKELQRDKMDKVLFQRAYLEKLQYLIEKEIEVPLAVILDRFFTAPHLASGEPKEIALAMWRELEEIRKPAVKIIEWLDDPGPATLKALLGPGSPPDPDPAPVTDEELRKELEALTLEQFLELV